jgi:methionyl-tRNA formyltransferase
MSVLRIVFMGTPELACASLKTLAQMDVFQVVGVVTQPDRPKGRDLKLTASPVKQFALEKRLTLFQPEKVRNEETLAALRELKPDLIAVAAYGQILPEAILKLPPYGCLNVHTSLLPRYRGAAPIQWAILNDDAQTGVTIMKMDAGMDTGEIVAQAPTEIAPDDNAQTLHDRLAVMGGELLVQTIPDFVAGRIRPHPQPAEGVVYAPKIKKQDGLIDWALPARTLWNRVRGLLPWPGAFTFTSQNGKKDLLKIWEGEIAPGSGPPGNILQADRGEIIVACGKDALRIMMLQREGGRRLTAREFQAGKGLATGLVLG